MINIISPFWVEGNENEKNFSVFINNNGIDDKL